MSKLQTCCSQVLYSKCQVQTLGIAMLMSLPCNTRRQVLYIDSKTEGPLETIFLCELSHVDTHFSWKNITVIVIKVTKRRCRLQTGEYNKLFYILCNSLYVVNKRNSQNGAKDYTNIDKVNTCEGYGDEIIMNSHDD